MNNIFNMKQTMHILNAFPQELRDKVCDLMYTLRIETFEEALSLLYYIHCFDGDIEAIAEYIQEQYDIDTTRLPR